MPYIWDIYGVRGHLGTFEEVVPVVGKLWKGDEGERGVWRELAQLVRGKLRVA